MKSEQSMLVTGANESGAFEQTKVTPYAVFEEAVVACNEANRESESRHDVRNDAGKECYAYTWIAWSRSTRCVGSSRSGRRAAHVQIL